MKWTLFVVAFVALLFMVVASPQVAAQAPDTVKITLTAPGELRKAIDGDTLANGQRKNPNRVYSLLRGQRYLMDATQNIKFNLTLIADAANPSSAPPCLVPAIKGDGSAQGDWFNIQKGNVVFKNIWFKTIRADKQQVPWNGGTIQINADSCKAVITNCIFEFMTGSQSIVIGSKYTRVFIMDNLFVNGQHPTSWFGGGSCISSPVQSDTLVLTNNTMFYSGGYLCGTNREFNRYLHIEHNTVFGNHVNPLYCPYISNAVIKNNIWYATVGMGISEVERDGGWFDWKGAVTSTISIDTIPTDIKTRMGITEASRFVQVKNNAYFWPQKQKDFWKANDTVIKYTPTWMNARTKNMFDTNKTAWPKLVQSGNVEKDPGFPTREMAQIDSLIKYCALLRTGKQTDFSGYFNPAGDLYATPWPYNLNLAYTDVPLQTGGDDGLPVGDLNWFPTKRALYNFKPTAVEPIENGIPEAYSLSQNYPNPFNPATKIEFSIPKQANVLLKVFNILGQEVATLVSETLNAGHYAVDFDASKLASGAYIYRFTAGDFVSVNKMVLMK